MNVETLVETNLAIVLPGFFAPLLATDDTEGNKFSRAQGRPHVFGSSLMSSLNRLPFRDWPIRESVIPLKGKKLQLPFLFSVHDVQFPFIIFILTQAPESPVPLQSYSTTFQSVTGPGTSGTGVLKNC